MKIVTLSAPFPGARRPLEEGQKLGLWDFILIDRMGIHIPEADIYIVAAWHPVYKGMIEMLSRHCMGVLWTSSVGEVDFEPLERGYLDSIVRDERIRFIGFGDETFANVFNKKGFYFPYPLSCKDSHPTVPKQEIITLFCPAGPKKNILNQLMAVILVQRDRGLTLHTNIEGYDHILRHIKHVKHSWLPAEEFRQLISSSKVNLAVSWAETFNYQVAEASLNHTASVISATVPVPGGEEVVNPCDCREIADKILKVADGAVNYGKMVREVTERWAGRQNLKTKEALAKLELRLTERVI